MPDTPREWLAANGRKWKRAAAGYVKGTLRRRADELWPSRETREYQQWITRRIEFRKSLYRQSPIPGLLSILTPVWDGSPVNYLRELADSIAVQNGDGACEWVVLDNGCSKANVVACLRELRALTWVNVQRSTKNLGITRGLRMCLEQAAGRYVLPVDADDRLDADALQIVTAAIVAHDYPALLYTDEDKVIGSRRYQPYLKPDWDPVLLLNSAYIAHLGVVDRRMALELGAYSDERTESSPDWDIFIRFLIAGHSAIHIPEVVYSWRVHANSTADDAASKPNVHASQQRVLQRFLDSRPDGDLFAVEYSPLLGGAPHWHFRSKREDLRPMQLVRFGDNTSCKMLSPLASEMAQQDGLIAFISEEVEVESPDWQREADSIFELHPNTVMVGGRIRDEEGRILEAGLCFGFSGCCGSPDAGRTFKDPGYFGQMWKQRSVSAVSARFAVIRATFLRQLLETLPAEASHASLGIWAGAQAWRESKRVVYTPFLSGICRGGGKEAMSASEQELFMKINGDLIPDHRFYSRFFGLEKPFDLVDPSAPTVSR